MKSTSPPNELARRLAEREEVEVGILELEGLLAKVRRRLDEVSAEIDSLQHRVPPS
ncbi:hypothetical protein P3H15_52785 [Rhodococcus sp. T2V]|uniref:hypothetical protein n=1 Tax=Rhodococcus sp. T2V TaxID=3034164 RepID=UPI0023E35143|nr:hypothetical protein [Rhodococcus sp. T2V]MDF3313574.1 hypothetical protein [Rhodococcus sp. T2V]